MRRTFARRALPLLALLLAGACRAAPASAPATPDPLAAQATPVRIAATPKDDFADLAPFGAAVGSARIVALDEQTHGGHEEFVLKTRLLRYLHERLGFDVLVLESGFFDVGELEQAAQLKARIADLAPGNIFFMYSKSAEGQAMLRYVDSTRGTPHPLTLVGMDSQHSGTLSRNELLPQLATFMGRYGSPAPTSPDWPGFAATVAELVALHPAPPSPADLAAFGDRLGRLVGTRRRRPAGAGAAAVDRHQRQRARPGDGRQHRVDRRAPGARPAHGGVGPRDPPDARRA